MNVYDFMDKISNKETNRLKWYLADMSPNCP